MGGKGDNRARYDALVQLQGTNPPQRVETAHDGHFDIHEDDVRAPQPACLHSLTAVARRSDPQWRTRQEQLHDQRIVGIVIDQQNA
ncbi:hypothetical protein D3C84_509190 [compost metagenome]